MISLFGTNMGTGQQSPYYDLIDISVVVTNILTLKGVLLQTMQPVCSVRADRKEAFRGCVGGLDWVRLVQPNTQSETQALQV